MAKLVVAAVLILITLVVISCVTWRLHARALVMMKMRGIGSAAGRLTYEGKPSLVASRVFHFNTFDDEWLTRKDIEAIFDQATASMETRLGRAPRIELKTDIESYPSLHATWDCPNGFIKLIAASGNDNDSVRLEISPGVAPVDVSAKPAARSMLHSMLRE